jgi:hypothetical protein
LLPTCSKQPARGWRARTTARICATADWLL